MMKTKLMLGLFLIGALLNSSVSFAKAKDKTTKQDTLVNSSLVSGLKFRSVGPAFTSGRIADFAVNPSNFSEFYVAVASGNIWKTTNAGTTFKPIFESYGAYSIGALAMDPNNSNVLWAGTGENNHQRALGYGDGVYLTLDGGESWKNMGLKESRQIGMIQVDPRNSNVVFVAAEGSAWGPGGDRGLYKTVDQGKTWTKVLEISENTGVNNVVFDPRNPDIMYATSEQRRRHVHTKVGGGPESAVYKSTDGGNNWRKIMKGLPKEHIGGMGMAISPQNPDVLYLIVEAANKSGGFFKTTNRGESWKKMSKHHSSGQYYNEIFCDPVEFDKIYSVETFTHYTIDGGKTWERLGTKDRHVDDHALWINPKDNNHMMIGGDGGVYITYDHGKNWRQVSNLPITQFYRVTVDNELPFYNIYGGTQDNATLGGPSRNTSTFGVTSGEWIVTVFGDGFWSRVDPKDPNIVYSEWQYGNVVRYDKKSGEKISIKPQPRENELTYRWNWNAPLILSPHNHKTLYMAANKVFKSEDRGDTWQVISEDLTAQIDRNTWPVMGKYWSIDAVVKDVSTSQYNTLVSLEESTVKKDLLYAGSDDGVIQITTNGGANWMKKDKFPGVPAHTYVSDILASKFDENVVYASFDNRKRDDFKPYLLKSNDKGNTWFSIASNLPVNGTVHTIEQDAVNKNLLFVGTEFGAFFTINGGKDWVQLKAGIPTIAVRDLAIQERESDLVLATFGRGFYVLDDYSPLRELSEEVAKKDAHMFPVKDALLYMQTGKIYGQGATYYGAKNPEFGATFTFYQKETPKSLRKLRHKKEKELFKKGQAIPQPTWKSVQDEEKEIPAYLLYTIRDMDGSVIRTMVKKPTKGINRVNWDLKYQSESAAKVKDFDPFKKDRGGVYVMPGKYSVEVSMVQNNQVTKLTEAQEFVVKSLNNASIPAENRQEMVAFQVKVSKLSKSMMASVALLNDMKKELALMQQTALVLPDAHEKLLPEINNTKNEVDELLFRFKGVKAKASWEEVPPAEMPLQRRLSSIVWAQINSTSNITSTSKQSYDILSKEYPVVLEQIKKLASEKMPELRKVLDDLDAPYTPGRIPDWK